MVLCRAFVLQQYFYSLVGTTLNGSEGADFRLMAVELPVGKIQPGYIHPGPDHAAEDFLFFTRRADGADYSGFGHSTGPLSS